MVKINIPETPLVSIIMNCYNCEKFLREAIDSVYAQTYDNWEIIFWDNASTDNSLEIAKSYDSKLKSYHVNELSPLYTARNMALEHVKGKVVAFLDCDDIWLNDKLERQIVEYLSGYKFVYGGYEIIDSKGQSTGNIEEDNQSGHLTSKILKKNLISIGSVLIDVELLKQNKFDPVYDLLGDFDLWIRLSVKTEISSVEGIVELSRQHGENTSLCLKNNWLKERRYFYKKFLVLFSVFRYPYIFLYIIKTELKGLIK